MKILSYTVIAGKVEDWEDPDGYYQTERNVKVALTYNTIEEALIIYNQCFSYHFNELTMAVEIKGLKYDILLDPEHKLLMDLVNQGGI